MPIEPLEAYQVVIKIKLQFLKLDKENVLAYIEECLP